MKILWLTVFAPWPPHGGGKIRTTNFVRRLAAAGDEIELWSVTDQPWALPDPHLERVQQRYFPLRPRNGAISKLASLTSPLPTGCWQLRSTQVLRAFGSASDFDVAVLDTALAGAFMPEVRAAGLPWLFDAANVEHSVMRQISRHLPDPVTRFRFALDAVKFRRLETQLVARSAACVAVSEQDARALESLHPGAHVEVHQTGVDLSHVRFVDHSHPRAARLVMTGTLGYYPNLDASRWFITEVMPLVRRRLPAATLTLVGGPVPSELKKVDARVTGVHVVGPVPDVQPFLDQADLFVIPLRLGGGTRIKAVEALAAGLPIVGTRLGVTGLGIVERDLAVLAETAEDFAAAIERGLVDLELRARLVHEGRRCAEERFDFDRIAADFRITLQKASAASRR